MKNTKTILVADDDKNITLALARRLEANHYNVLTAPNGLDALKIALEEKPDLILMDIWMPSGIGLSVAERMKELGVKIPVIFLTASRQPGTQEAVQQIGAAAYIEKPYHPDQLMQTIEQTLSAPCACSHTPTPT